MTGFASSFELKSCAPGLPSGSWQATANQLRLVVISRNPQTSHLWSYEVLARAIAALLYRAPW